VFYWQVASWMASQLAAWKPDAVILQGTELPELAQRAVDHGVPIIMRMLTAECPERLATAASSDGEVARLLASPLVKIVSNSRFVASLVEALFGTACEVDYPFIERAHSTVADRAAECITFINPRQIKGLDIAFDVAALLPDRRFIFAEAHILSRAERSALDRGLRNLPNVSFHPHAESLKSVYARTALLMVPSSFREAFGRVIVEACANGIPVVARNIGGIPEAMGNSGVLLDEAAPPELWAKTIESILSDPDRCAELSTAAVANAQREEFDPAVIATGFLGILRKHIDQNKARVGVDIGSLPEIG
jgi:glycosyltransferase involved in cell wall biosynthesis